MCSVSKFINHMFWRYSLKMKIFESKMGFNNSCSFHPGSENILLSWDIIWLCNSVQVIQIAAKINNNMLTANTVNKDHLNQRVKHSDACNTPDYWSFYISVEWCNFKSISYTTLTEMKIFILLQPQSSLNILVILLVGKENKVITLWISKLMAHYEFVP